MSRPRDVERWWSPPGLPAATARVTQSRRSALRAGLLALLIVAGYGVLRGARPGDGGGMRWVLLIAAAGAAFIMLQNVRAEILIGKGWVAGRTLLRRRWVRTNDLSHVAVHRSGVNHSIVLRDRDGRKAALQTVDLQLDPRVRQQLAAALTAARREGTAVPEKAFHLLLP